MIDPKVVALRHFRALVAVDVAAGDYSAQEGLAKVHYYCDRLWPPAVVIAPGSRLHGLPASP